MVKKRTSCNKALQAVDLFGRPISLTHEGQHSFTSPIGGGMTVVFALILIALGIEGFTRVVFNEINNVSESMQ